MPTVRCPSCGAANPNGRRRLARCRICREALGKCRYCKHYDARLLDCTHLSHRLDERILDADATLNCPEFDSTLVISRLPHRFPLALLRTAALCAAALLLMLAAIYLYTRPPRPLPPVFLKTSVAVPGITFRESGFDVTVLVRNQAEHTARDVQVTIHGPSLPHLTCQYIDPPEAYLEGAPKSVCALVGDLEPGEIGSVLFHFLASRPGEFDLTAHVTATNFEAVQTVPIEGEVVP